MGVAMAEPFVGEIRLFGFSFAPRGFALCNGQTLAISQNQALFALLGTTYGGNGSTTFALPDLQGRTPIHLGTSSQGSTVQGAIAGAEQVTLTINTIPAHTHQLMGTSATADKKPAAGHSFANDTSPAVDFYAPPGPIVTINPQSIANAGGSQPHANVQPYLVLNYCIALQGIFPSRN
jgi:microcystin-dependent protein